MHLDWVRENEGRNLETRKLIRRRAIQAATTTKANDHDSKQKFRRGGQQLQPWVVDAPCSGQRNYQLEPAPRPKCLARPLQSPLLLKTTPVISSAFAASDHLVRILRSATLARCVFQAIQCPSIIPDEHVKHFIVLALADADYLQAISSCYGRSACLDAAIECLAPRIEEFLTGRASPASTLQLYARALQVLRKAIDNSAFNERFEIYYAIPLLVLFELLNASDRLALMTHARGGVHMLHLIGPNCMTTDLNKALLAMQSDLKVTEDIQHGDAHCCSGSNWHRALRQAIRYDTPPGTMQSEANITLNIIATALPGAFTSAENVVRTPQQSYTTSLAEKLATIAHQLRMWRLRWQPELLADSHRNTNNEALKVLIAIFLMYTAIIHRLIFATPGPPCYRAASEYKALDAANQALEIITSQSYDVIARARLAIVSTFVRSITETDDEWQQEIAHMHGDQAISSASFAGWCARMGRCQAGAG